MSVKKYCWSGQNPPWTSWTRTQKTQTFDAIKAAGDEGITREEVCSNTGLPKQRVWFYLSELRRAGLIKRMGDAVDPTTLNPTEAKLHAMLALENAFAVNITDHANKTCSICRAAKDPDKRCQVYKDASRQFIRYSKIKALCLGAKTTGEETSAMRMAMLDLVKMVF